MNQGSKAQNNQGSKSDVSKAKRRAGNGLCEYSWVS